MVNDNIIESQRGKGNFVTEDTGLIQQLKNRLVIEQISLAYDQLHALDLTDAEIITEFQKYVEDRSKTNV
jgi:DNA-binding transcriptional regulator YhcF (GntR family)